MDCTPLVSWIETLLPTFSEVESLAFQNHLYGCFILMEDIAQGILSYSNGTLSKINGTFRLVADETFGEWGIRYYGFVMDGRTAWVNCPSAYQAVWMDLFQALSQLRSVEAGKAVDAMEDSLITLLQRHLPVDAFFFIALENEGSLPPDAVERVFRLLEGDTSVPLHPLSQRGGCKSLSPPVLSSLGGPPASLPASVEVIEPVTPLAPASPSSDGDEAPSSALSQAQCDPPRIKRRLAVTRRRTGKESIKPSLATTRRRK